MSFQWWEPRGGWIPPVRLLNALLPAMKRGYHGGLRMQGGGEAGLAPCACRSPYPSPRSQRSKRTRSPVSASKPASDRKELGAPDQRFLALKGRMRCSRGCMKRSRWPAPVAGLVDYAIPRVPVRQWVLAVPRRVRPFLQHNPKIEGAVTGILMRAVQTSGRARARTRPMARSSVR